MAVEILKASKLLIASLRKKVDALEKENAFLVEENKQLLDALGKANDSLSRALQERQP